MSNIVLCNLSDANKVVQEERFFWLVDVLISIGIPEEVISKDIRKFRGDMEQMGIEIIQNSSGNIDIYRKRWHKGDTEEGSGWLPAKEENLVAQWKEPKRIMRVEYPDGKKIKTKGVYYEIQLNEWSAIPMIEK